MTGRRLPKPEPGSFPPGYDENELSYWPCERGSFDLNIPGAGLACLRGHQVVEHEDGTITASPSIAVYRGQGNMVAHGYLQRGVWRAT